MALVNSSLLSIESSGRPPQIEANLWRLSNCPRIQGSWTTLKLEIENTLHTLVGKHPFREFTKLKIYFSGCCSAFLNGDPIHCRSGILNSSNQPLLPKVYIGVGVKFDIELTKEFVCTCATHLHPALMLPLTTWWKPKSVKLGFDWSAKIKSLRFRFWIISKRLHKYIC